MNDTHQHDGAVPVMSPHLVHYVAQRIRHTRACLTNEAQYVATIQTRSERLDLQHRIRFDRQVQRFAEELLANGIWDMRGAAFWKHMAYVCLQIAEKEAGVSGE